MRSGYLGVAILQLASCSSYSDSATSDAGTRDASGTLDATSEARDAGEARDATQAEDAQAPDNCATLSPWIACADFEPSSLPIRWVERKGAAAQSSVVSPGARSTRALSVTAISPDGGATPDRVAAHEVSGLPPGARLAFDVLVEDSSTGSNASVAALLQGGSTFRSDFLLGLTRNPDGSFDWYALLAQDSAGVPYRSVSIKATLAPNVWRHVELRANPTWTQLYVAFDYGPEFDLGASAGISPIVPGAQGAQVGYREGSGTWKLRFDNLVVRSP
jgi:hypothetical protein